MLLRWVNCLNQALVAGLLLSCLSVTQVSVLADEVEMPPEAESSGTLPLRLPVTPQPNYEAAKIGKVSGRVVLRRLDQAVGVAGVSVTDGYSVVNTDALGNYSLKTNPKAVFIYLTRPADNDVSGPWYQPIAAQVDFELQPAADDENDYTFIHVSDSHTSANLRSVEGLNQFVKEANALTPKPRFVVNSGDLVNLDKALESPPSTGHTYFRNYVGTMNHLTMPLYNVAGDHTDSSYRLNDFPRGDHRCGKPMYWEYLGPHFFSFEYGKIHFVSVDFGYHLGQLQIQGREYPTLHVQPMHTAWMQQDMAHRTKGTFVITTSESDLTDRCDGFAELAKRYDIRLQLTGDDHVVAHKKRAVPYRTGGALAGCWWNPKCERLCPDLSPQGYLVYQVRGEKMEVFYKGLGQRVAIVSHRVGAPLKAKVMLRAHLVQPKPNETLQYSFDGTSWKEMKETGRPFYRAVYEAMLDTSALPNGLVELKVRSSLSDETRTRTLVIANETPATLPNDGVLTISTEKRSNGTLKAPDGKVDVLINDQVVGALSPGELKAYSFSIPTTVLRKVNTLHFRFSQPKDGMRISGPVLTYQGKPTIDPRDQAVKKVKVAHWGANSVDWGGFVVGDGGLEASPFLRKQNVFCFVLE